MIIFLRGLFLVVLASMLCVTTWASLQCPLFAVPKAVATHPWGFTTFFVWVCYREISWTSKIAWFLAIMALGNIAMSSYCLAALFQSPTSAKVSDILTARRSGPGLLGMLLALVGVGGTVAAALVTHPSP